MTLTELFLGWCRHAQETLGGPTPTFLLLAIGLHAAALLLTSHLLVRRWKLEEQKHLAQNPASLSVDQTSKEGPMETTACIDSPTRTYRLIGPPTPGDLCDVYLATGDRECVLKVPRVVGGDHLLEREWEVLRELTSDDDAHSRYFPRPLETFRSDRRRINAFEWRDGYHTAEEILQRHPRGLDGRHLAWMFKRVLEALGRVHSQGWIHGAVTPPHLMFHAENHGLQLVGWIHAQPLNSRLELVPERFKSWYPPECLKREPAAAESDIYLAAKSMIYLAGGDPAKDAIPARVPAPVRRFLQECLLESSAMRPGDAWELHGEFSDLLEDVYGPPRFHRLEMK
ncbi:MAG: hypothetical protein N2C14_03830 [Planctomycetales bacterium]